MVLLLQLLKRLRKSAKVLALLLFRLVCLRFLQVLIGVKILHLCYTLMLFLTHELLCQHVGPLFYKFWHVRYLDSLYDLRQGDFEVFWQFEET